jgi:hypothetical protein
MNRSYDFLIGPMINHIKPSHILEIGTKEGLNTKKLYKYCLDNQVKLTCIDPYPDFDSKKLKRDYDKFVMHEDLSLNVLKKIKGVDLLLIDGDHNYYTVFHELNLIESIYKNKFPNIFLHDVSWPYARRDMYYDLENIPSDWINENRKSGVHPEKSGLLKGAINSNINNAINENTKKNGVLTAIEDFISKSDLELLFNKVNFKNGIGFICLKKNKTFAEKFIELSNNKRLTEALEHDFNKLNADYQYFKTNVSELISKILSEMQLLNKALPLEKQMKVQFLIHEYSRYISNFANRKLEIDYEKKVNSRLQSKSIMFKIILKGGIKKALKLRLNISRLKNSESFDANYYLFTYPDVYYSGINPYIHYLYLGKQEGRYTSK